MTEAQEIALGRTWAKLARTEGHERRMPPKSHTPTGPGAPLLPRDVALLRAMPCDRSQAAQALGIKIQSAGNALSRLHTCGLARPAGRHRPVTYHITDAGRKRLESSKDGKK